MEETKKTQWHPAFCSAVKLELTENKRDLSYNSEYNLNTKPISIDLLVIRKSPDVIINNEIGKIFKGHNIFEYKSPDNNMDIDTSHLEQNVSGFTMKVLRLQGRDPDCFHMMIKKYGSC